MRSPRRWVVLAVCATVGAVAVVGAVVVAGAGQLGPPWQGRVRAPATAAPQAWQVVGLGDSIPAGDGCDGCVGFLDLFGREITRDTARRVDVTNLGVGGWTSEDLLTSLTRDDQATGAVSGADIVTITIGANDFNPILDDLVAGRCGGADGLDCFQPAMDPLEHNLTAILDRVRQLRGARPTAVRVTGYWNVFIDGAVAARTWGPDFERGSQALTQQVNDLIRQVALDEHADYVDLFSRFKGADGQRDDTDLLAPDGDHPSQAGDQLIADSLAELGYRPLDTGP
ncbi:MAG TPA: SGNH/GDSL hydrolase family protein [Pseudonocardia sp.]|nr:SGNH/GDSL hydrolase family protein [Pseudonocardia sp.]